MNSWLSCYTSPFEYPYVSKQSLFVPCVGVRREDATWRFQWECGFRLDCTQHLAIVHFFTPTFPHRARLHDWKHQGPQNGAPMSESIQGELSFAPSCANPTSHIFLTGFFTDERLDMQHIRHCRTPHLRSSEIIWGMCRTVFCTISSSSCSASIPLRYYVEMGVFSGSWIVNFSCGGCCIKMGTIH